MRTSSETIYGITYLQIVDVACQGLTFAESAEKLGIERGQLRKALKRRGMLHWFDRKGGMPKGRRFPRGYKDISLGTITAAIAEHGSVTDAAVSLGMDRSTIYLRRKKERGGGCNADSA